jgi:hypothetical protein
VFLLQPLVSILSSFDVIFHHYSLTVAIEHAGILLVAVGLRGRLVQIEFAEHGRILRIVLLDSALQ